MLQECKGLWWIFAKSEEHSFIISGDNLYSEFYNSTCKPYDVITFLIYIIQNQLYL